MRIETDRARAHLGAVLDSLESPGPATQLMVLEAKASGTETAVDGHRTGDADVRRRGVRRRARHRAAVPRRAGADRDGADERQSPTSSSAAPCAAWRCSDVAPAEGRGGDVRPQGLGDLGNHPRLLRRAGGADRRRVLQHLRACRSTDCSSGAIDIAWNSPLAWLDAQRRSGDALPRHRHARHRSRSRLVRRGAARRSGADARRPAGPHDRHRRDRLAAGHAHSARPPAPRGARARESTSRSGGSTSSSASTAITSAASATRWPASRRATPRRARCST